MLFVNSNVLPELQPQRIETADLRKRAKHLRKRAKHLRKRAKHLLKCKEAVWRRWSREYLRSLRERHRAQTTNQRNSPTVGDVVIVQSQERNRGKWPLGIVEDLIVGTDGAIRGAVLRAGKSRIERAVQQLYPLELSCDRQRPHLTELNPQAVPFRPRRDAAVAARLRVQEMITQDEE